MRIFLLLILFLIPSCSFSTQQKIENEEEVSKFFPLVDLVESTTIIRAFITKNKIGELLEEHDPKDLYRLLNNMSPAQMAFGSEVLSTTIPLVVVYYYTDSPKSYVFIKQLQDLALYYHDRVKFVIIDADELFSLAQEADIQQYPSIAIFEKGIIIDRIEQDISIEAIDQIVTMLLRR